MGYEAEFEVFEDEGGEWRWRLQSTNGQVVAVSGEGYTSAGDAVRAITEGLGRAVIAVGLVVAKFDVAVDEIGVNIKTVS